MPGKQQRPEKPRHVLGYRSRLRYLLIEIRSLDLASLPRDNILAMIADFEQAPTAEALEELAGSLGNRVEAIEAPELAAAFAAWIMHVLTQRFGGAGREWMISRRFGPGTAEELRPVLERVTDRKTSRSSPKPWSNANPPRSSSRG